MREGYRYNSNCKINHQYFLIHNLLANLSCGIYTKKSSDRYVFFVTSPYCTIDASMLFDSILHYQNGFENSAIGLCIDTLQSVKSSFISYDAGGSILSQ